MGEKREGWETGSIGARDTGLRRERKGREREV